MRRRAASSVGLLLPILVGAAAGCRSYGYATLPAPGAQTRAALRQRAEQAGLEHSRSGDGDGDGDGDGEVDRYQVTILTEPNVDLNAPAPRPLAPRKVTMQVRADEGGTVELSSERPAVFRALTDGLPLRWYRTPYAPRAATRWRARADVELGQAQAPGHSGVRVDTMIRAGHVLLQRGGDDREHIGNRHALSALAGAGISFDGRGAALREEVTLALERARLVTPMQGRELLHGPTLALELSLATLQSLDGERDTVEVSLGLEVAGLAGMFARLGHQWGPVEDRGNTRMLGVQLDGTVVLHGAGFAVGAAIQLAASAGLMYLWSKGCEGNQSTSSTLCG